jgi:hypothetical protein
MGHCYWDLQLPLGHASYLSFLGFLVHGLCPWLREGTRTRLLDSALATWHSKAGLAVDLPYSVRVQVRRRGIMPTTTTLAYFWSRLTVRQVSLRIALDRCLVSLFEGGLSKSKDWCCLVFSSTESSTASLRPRFVRPCSAFVTSLASTPTPQSASKSTAGDPRPADPKSPASDG